LTVALDPIRPDWLGARPDRVQVASAFLIGIVGIVVAGLQPVLLGTLQASGRITNAERQQLQRPPSPMSPPTWPPSAPMARA
jgi:hypothetical protein